MQKILLTLLLGFLSSLVIGQGAAFISVVVEVEELPPGKSVHVRGDHVFFGKWKPGEVRLQKKNATEWVGLFIFQKGETASFVVDLGKTTEGAKLAETSSDSITFTVTSDSVIQVKVESFDGAGSKYIPPATYHNIPGTVPNGLRDRLVVVRTPFDYDQDTTKLYPVIYFQDGQDAFNDREALKGLEWRIDEVLDSMTEAELIEPCIVVAIQHVAETRSLEYNDTEIGTRYRDYLSSVLHPLIERLYRVSDDPKDHIIMGGGTGGFVSFLTAWERPDLFGGVASFSAPFKIYDNDIFQVLDKHEGESKPINFYVDIGEFGFDEELLTGHNEMLDFLSENEYTYQSHFEPNTINNVESYRKRLPIALNYFLGKSPEE